MLSLANKFAVKPASFNILKILLEKGIIKDPDDIDLLFSTQGKVDILNSANLDIIKVLLEKGIIRGADDVDGLFCTQRKVDRLNSIYELPMFQILLKEKIMRDPYCITVLFGTQEKINRLNELYELPMFQTLLEEKIIRDSQGMMRLFGTQWRIDILNSINLDIIKVLLEKGIIRDYQDVCIFFFLPSTQEEIDRLNSINLDIYKILLEEGIISSVFDIPKFSKNADFAKNATKNLFLTKTILNIDGLVQVLGTNGIVNFISNAHYTESSGDLIRNCRLACVLYQKGVIEDITVDYLFDNERIKNNTFAFIKEKAELIDATITVPALNQILNNVFKKDQEDPMPKLKDVAFEKLMKSIYPSY